MLVLLDEKLQVPDAWATRALEQPLGQPLKLFYDNRGLALPHELRKTAHAFHLYTRHAFDLSDAEAERAHGPDENIQTYHTATDGQGATLHIHAREMEDYEEETGHSATSDIMSVQQWWHLVGYLDARDKLDRRTPKDLAIEGGGLPDLIAAYAVAKSLDDFLDKSLTAVQRATVVQHYEGVDKFRGVALATGLRYAAWSDVAVQFEALTQPWGFFLDSAFAYSLHTAGFDLCKLADLDDKDFGIITAYMQLPARETGGRAAEALAHVTKRIRR